MPAWKNTDTTGAKPKWVVERQTREVIMATVATGNNSGNTVLTFTYWDGTASSNLSNVISVGSTVATLNIGANGLAGFFTANNNVASISGNTVTFSQPFYGNVVANTVVEFDKTISWKANVPQTYFADTILISPARSANNTTANGCIANTGNINAGWVHIQKKTNNDGTVRYLKETLVALANVTTANVNSGNTSFGQFVSGL